MFFVIRVVWLNCSFAMVSLTKVWTVGSSSKSRNSWVRVKVSLGASVAKLLAHLPFTSEAAGSSLSENFLNATRTQSSCEKSKSQRSAESRVFPPGTPVSSHRES
jgi:hypothetical protein